MYNLVLFCGVKVNVFAPSVISTVSVWNMLPSASLIVTVTVPLTTSLLEVLFVRFTVIVNASLAVTSLATLISTSVGIKLILSLVNELFVSALGLYTVSPLNSALITRAVLSAGV